MVNSLYDLLGMVHLTSVRDIFAITFILIQFPTFTLALLPPTGVSPASFHTICTPNAVPESELSDVDDDDDNEDDDDELDDEEEDELELRLVDDELSDDELELDDSELKDDDDDEELLVLLLVDDFPSEERLLSEE